MWYQVCAKKKLFSQTKNHPPSPIPNYHNANDVIFRSMDRE